MGRTGRRRGQTGDTQRAIVDAARACFASDGYDGATIRAVARLAAVDPALIYHYYGNKEQLFAAAMQLPVDPAETVEELLAAGVDDLGRNLVRMFLRVWDDGAHPLTALIRSAVANEQAAAMIRQFFAREILGRVAGALEVPDADLRATLVGSQMVGLAVARYIVGFEPLASADPEVVVAAIAPTVQRYLTGAIDGRPAWAHGAND